MPFQGARAPETSLAMILQLRQNRISERRSQQDFGLRQFAAEAKEKRAQQKFISDQISAKAKVKADELKLLAGKLALDEKIAGSASGLAEARENVDRQFTSEDLTSGLTNTAGGDPFASIIQGLDPSGFTRGVNASFTLESRTASAAKTLQQLSSISPEAARRSVLGAATSFRGAETRLAEIELEKKIAQENRDRATLIATESRAVVVSNAKKRRDEQALAERLPKAAIAANRAFRRESEKASDPDLTDRQREFARRNTISIENRIAQKEGQGLSGELVKGREARLRARADHRRDLDMRDALADMIANPQFLGPNANISQLIGNISGLAEDLLGQSERFAMDFIERKDVSQENRDLIESLFLNGFDPDANANISITKLQELRVVWVLENINNPNGRTAMIEINNIRKTVGFTGFFISSRLGVARLRSVLKVMNRAIRRSAQGLKDRDRKIQFDDDFNIVGDFDNSRESVFVGQSNRRGSVRQDSRTDRVVPPIELGQPQRQPGAVDDTLLQPIGTPAGRRQRDSAQRLIDRGF